MDFDTAFATLIDPNHEGGYANNRADPGGETMYGVTIKVARAYGYTGPMAAMPVETAKAIYKAEYWAQGGCDLVPDVMKFQVFEMSVNTGQEHARKALQTAAGAAVDGVLGTQSLMAIQTMVQQQGDVWLYMRFCAAQLLYYTSCGDWPAFGRQWVNREAYNMLHNRKQ